MTVFRNRGRGGRWSYNFTLRGERFQGYCIDPETNVQAKTRSQATEIEATLKRTVRQQIGSVRSGIQSGSFTLAQALPCTSTTSQAYRSPLANPSLRSGNFG